MKNTTNFLLGVVYSVKEKVRIKGQKWGGIIANADQRQRWEERLARQGSAYRRELTNELNRRIHRSSQVNLPRDTSGQRRQLEIGEEIEFFSLADNVTLQAKVLQPDLYHKGEFLLVESANQVYVCRDLGDRLIGDKEF